MIALMGTTNQQIRHASQLPTRTTSTAKTPAGGEVNLVHNRANQQGDTGRGASGQRGQGRGRGRGNHRGRGGRNNSAPKTSAPNSSNQCQGCGGNPHPQGRSQCPAQGQTSIDADDYNDLYTDIFAINDELKPAPTVEVMFSGVSIKAVIDSGSAVTITSSSVWQKMGQPPLERVSNPLRTFASSFLSWADVKFGLKTSCGHHHIQPTLESSRTVSRLIQGHRAVQRSTGAVDHQARCGPHGHSSSPHTFPSKPDGALRLCVDMRCPNKAIERRRIVMPTVEDLIASFNGCQVFSKLDHGVWRYKRLNFGVNAAAEIFQEVVQNVLPKLPAVRNTIDDILIGGKTMQEHDERLVAVLQALQNAGMTAKPTKCEFRQTKVKFFGHMFSAQGISLDPDRIKDIVTMPPPMNAAEVRSLLGMVVYCSRFIPGLATIAEPLRQLTRDDVEFIWNQTQQEAWDVIKRHLSTAPTLGFFDPQLESVVITDASPVGVAGVFLLGCPFSLLTDHLPLVSIFKNPRSTLSTRLQRLLLRLSRHPAHRRPANAVLETEIFVQATSAMAVPKAWTRADLRHAVLTDDTLRPYAEIWQELAVTSDGLVMRGDCIVVPKSLQPDIIKLAHKGHQGIQRTKQLLRSKADDGVKPVPITMTPLPSRPWSTISIHFAQLM